MKRHSVCSLTAGEEILLPAQPLRALIHIKGAFGTSPSPNRQAVLKLSRESRQREFLDGVNVTDEGFSPHIF